MIGIIYLDIAMIRMDRSFVIQIGSGIALDTILRNIHRGNQDLILERITISGWGYTESENECQTKLWRAMNQLLPKGQVQCDNEQEEYNDESILVSNHRGGKMFCDGDSGGTI